nr:Chain PA, GLN-LEU-ARG-GLN [synthetic construct]7QHK_PB Chain PB, GLN-LEU-ARG-GLN [synthetic construct]
QLRQQE